VVAWLAQSRNIRNVGCVYDATVALFSLTWSGWNQTLANAKSVKYTVQAWALTNGSAAEVVNQLGKVRAGCTMLWGIERRMRLPC
jgi:hypothetical protein